MTSVATVIDRVRRELFGPQRHLLNTLQTVLGPNVTDQTFTLSYGPDGIATGSLLGVEDEIVYVLSVDRPNRIVNVLRAQLGSTIASHNTGVVVEVNPRFFRGQILDVLKEEIDSWPQGVYRVAQLDPLVAAVGVRGFALTGMPSDWLAILQVERSALATPGLVDPKALPRLSDYRIVRRGAAFPEGGIVFSRDFDSGTLLYVTYSRPFATNPWNETLDLEADCGLSSTMLDALKYGALWRLTSTLDISREDPAMNVDTRTAQGTAGTPNIQVAMNLLRLRDRRISDEATRLLGVYGMPET